jgi:predicted glycoside hydrolase/deacetylase ChbG (UPF0249 family)
MMNMPGIEEALRTAEDQCPRLGLGVHLVLTAGRPLRPTAQVRSLTGGHDLFSRPEALVLRLSALEYGQVLDEWRAQVERFAVATGRPPDHLDAHHHAAYWTPLLLRAMLELAREYGCAVRLPTGAEAEKVDIDLPAGLVQPLSAWALPLLDEFLPRHPDHLDTSFYGPAATREVLLSLLTHLPPGTTELMCHPGHADAELLAGSGYNRQREAEAAILTDPAVAAQAEAQGVGLISFAQL